MTSSTPDTKQTLRDPFHILMARLAGIDKPPRAHTAQQQWQKENWATGAGVEATVLAEWMAQTGVAVPIGSINMDDEDLLGDSDLSTTQGVEETPAYPPINFITKVATRMFLALPKEEQVAWKTDAQEEAREAKEAFKAQMEKPLGVQTSTSRAR